LVGRGLAEFRRHADDIQRTIQREIHTPLQDEDLLKKAAGPAQAYPGPPPDAATTTARPEDDTSPSPPPDSAS
jgi:hypothetical protein